MKFLESVFFYLFKRLKNMALQNASRHVKPAVQYASKYTYIFDNGHGGINPTTDQYVTSGKRSPKFEDKFFADGSPFVLYEGVNNRDNVKRIVTVFEAKGIKCLNLVDTWRDVSLTQRVRDINELAQQTPCIVISIHSDAYGNGHEFNSANGIGSFQSVHASRTTHDFNEIMETTIQLNFVDFKWRGIKKRNFAILRCNPPAILLELGFHTNKFESEEILSEDFKERVVKTMFEAITTFEQLQE